MKLGTLVIILALAITCLAQTATPAAPPPAAPDSKACACCNHDKVEGDAKGACSDCCKDGKCAMMSGSPAAMKCPMMAKNEKTADGKMCCASNKCTMHANGGKGSSCCSGGMDPKHAEM